MLRLQCLRPARKHLKHKECCGKGEDTVAGGDIVAESCKSVEILVRDAIVKRQHLTRLPGISAHSPGLR